MAFSFELKLAIFSELYGAISAGPEHPTCEEIIAEFENYSWKKDKQSGEYVNEPIDKFNHYIDALRYSL